LTLRKLPCPWDWFYIHLGLPSTPMTMCPFGMVPLSASASTTMTITVTLNSVKSFQWYFNASIFNLEIKHQQESVKVNIWFKREFWFSMGKMIVNRIDKHRKIHWHVFYGDSLLIDLELTSTSTTYLNFWYSITKPWP
jgi:hypothetical protein